MSNGNVPDLVYATPRLVSFELRDASDQVIPFVVSRLSGTEQVSSCFHFTIELAASNKQDVIDQIVSRPIIGQFAALAITNDINDLANTRFVRGVITRFRSRGLVNSYLRFELDFVPWFSLLGRRSHCRVFQNEHVLDIFDTIYQEWYEARSNEVANVPPSGTYDVLDFCAQYRESDRQFLERLLEREGISYFFPWRTPQTGDQPHSLATALTQVGNNSDFESNVATEAIDLSASYTVSWETEERLVDDPTSVRDFDFRTNSPLQWGTTANQSNRWPTSHDYPAGYEKLWAESVDDPADVHTRGIALSDIALQSRVTSGRLAHAETSYIHLRSGRIYDVVDGGNAVGSFVVLKLEHEIVQSMYPADTTTNSIRNRVLLVEHQPAAPYRPVPVTPKPVVEGPQTAIVVAPEESETGDLNTSDVDDEIGPQSAFVDSLGRIKIRFHWAATTDTNSLMSCWVRVAQESAGSGYGAYSLPHVGQEVIVSFLEGDPDRPLVTGRVYNGENKSKFCDTTTDPAQDAESHTKPQVSVVARDQIKNEISMDSSDDNARILLKSPKGEDSYILIGDPGGIAIRTDGGISEYFGGSDVRHTYENSYYMTVGFGTDFRFGGALDVVIGTQIDCTIGTSVGVQLGIDADFNYSGRFLFDGGVTYSKTTSSTVCESTDDFDTTTSQAINMDGKVVCITGGSKTTAPAPVAADATVVNAAFDFGTEDEPAVAAPAPSNTSRFVASDDGIKLEFTPNSASPGQAAAAGGAIVSAGILGVLSAIAVPLATGLAVKDNPSGSPCTTVDTLLATGTCIAAAHTTTASIAILHAAAEAAKTQIRNKSNTDSLTPTSKLSLEDAEASFQVEQGDDKTTVDLDTASGCKVDSTSDVKLDSRKKIEITGNEVEIKGGDGATKLKTSATGAEITGNQIKLG